MTTPKKIAPCFAYPGGKTRLLPQILPLIPAHRRYIEPFAGGLAVLLAKDRSPIEVINDLNSEVANFYRYVRHHPDALFCELENQFNSREDFELLKKNEGLTDLQRAVRWYVMKVNSFAGYGETYGRSRDHYSGYDRLRDRARIDLVSQRLNRVVIENRDWEEVVAFYDSPRAFHFFDPPYVDCGKTAYDAFAEEDMARIAGRLPKLKGSWLLTCDDSAITRKLFSGMIVRKISSQYSNANAKPGQKRLMGKQLMVLSPDLVNLRKAA